MCGAEREREDGADGEDTRGCHRPLREVHRSALRPVPRSERAQRAQLHKRLEYLFQLFLGNTRARVANAYEQTLVFDAPFQLDRSSGRREFHRIGQKIHDDLLHLLAIGEDAELIVAILVIVADALLCKLRRHERLSAAESLLDRDFGHGELDRPAFELREIENHVHQCEQVLLRLVNTTNIAPLFSVSPRECSAGTRGS